MFQNKFSDYRSLLSIISTWTLIAVYQHSLFIVSKLRHPKTRNICTYLKQVTTYCLLSIFHHSSSVTQVCLSVHAYIPSITLPLELPQLLDVVMEDITFCWGICIPWTHSILSFKFESYLNNRIFNQRSRLLNFESVYTYRNWNW